MRRLSACAAACAALWIGQQAFADCDTITVIGASDWPPFSYAELGELTGAAIETTRDILTADGRAVEVASPRLWPDAFAAVAAGEIDVLAGAYFTSERNAALMFSPQLAIEPMRIFARLDDPKPIATLNDLKGRRGVWLRGRSFGEAFDRYAATELDITNLPAVEVIPAIAWNEADYTVLGETAGLADIARRDMSDRIGPVGDPVFSSPVYLGVSRESACDDLLLTLSLGLERMRAEGALQKLVARHATDRAATVQTQP